MFGFSYKDDKFFDLFALYAEGIHNSALLFEDFVHHLDKPEQRLKDIKDIAIKCSQTLRRIYKELHKSFITPIDREDIVAIAQKMNDIVRLIEAAAVRFVIFNVKQATPEAKELSRLVTKGAALVIQLMAELKKLNKSKKLLHTVGLIKRVEEEGDEIFRKALGKLFSEPLPVLEVIKGREIYEQMKVILVACKDAADTVEGVVIKHG